MNDVLPSTLPVTPDDLGRYLDTAIRHWRRLRDESDDPMAQYYIDAFQSVRVSFFGEVLPPESQEVDSMP